MVCEVKSGVRAPANNAEIVAYPELQMAVLSNWKPGGFWADVPQQQGGGTATLVKCWWGSGGVLREKFLQGDVSFTHMRSCHA